MKGTVTGFVVSFHRVLNTVRCPVLGCLEVAHIVDRMRAHFLQAFLCSYSSGARGEGAAVPL